MHEGSGQLEDHGRARGVVVGAVADRVLAALVGVAVAGLGVADVIEVRAEDHELIGEVATGDRGHDVGDLHLLGLELHLEFDFERERFGAGLEFFVDRFLRAIEPKAARAQQSLGLGPLHLDHGDRQGVRQHPVVGGVEAGEGVLLAQFFGQEGARSANEHHAGGLGLNEAVDFWLSRTREKRGPSYSRAICITGPSRRKTSSSRTMGWSTFQ